MYNTIMLAAAPSGAESPLGSPVFLILMIGVLALMMFFSSRSNKKKEKETQSMLDSTQVGDEIVTIGGIVGRVVKMEEATVLLESGADRSKIRLKKEAIRENISALEKRRDEKAREQEKLQKARDDKKKAK